MGRILDEKNASKTSTEPKKVVGRILTKQPPKKTLGEKVLNTGTAVSTFLGGKAVSEAIGAKIAREGAAPDEKQYIESPTKKQVVASAGELGLNIAGLIPGVGVAAKGLAAGNKARYGALALEGAAYGGGQAALRGVQDQKSSKDIIKSSLIGAGIGAVAAPIIGRIFRGKAPDNIPVAETASTITESVTPRLALPAPKVTTDFYVGPAGVSPTMKGARKAPKTLTPEQVERNTPAVYDTNYIPDNELPVITAKDVKTPAKNEFKATGFEEPRPVVSEPVIDEVVPLRQTTQEVPRTEPVKKTKPVESIKDPVQVLDDATVKTADTDPVINKTTFDEQTAKYNEVASQNSVDDLIDMSMGKKPIPDGLAKNTVYELTKNRSDLTAAQVRRLANTAPESEAGLNLVLTKLRAGGIVDNPTDMVKVVEKKLREATKNEAITKTTIKRFIDDIGCTM